MNMGAIKRGVLGIAAEIILGTLFAFLGVACFLGFAYVMLDILKLSPPLTIDTFRYLILTVGIPVGSLLGILLGDKVVRKSKDKNVKGTIIGYMLGASGVWFTVIVYLTIDAGAGVFLLPLIGTSFSLIGFHSPIAIRCFGAWFRSAGL